MPVSSELKIAAKLPFQHADEISTPNYYSVKMVDAGWLGRKSGRGFYEYEGK